MHEGASRDPRLATTWPIEWPKIVAELEGFDAVYKRVLALRGLDHEGLVRQADLIEGLAHAEETRFWPSKPLSEFQRWLKDQAGVAAPYESLLNIKLRRQIRDAAYNFFAPPKLDAPLYDPSHVPALISAVQAYMDVINELMRKTAAARFSYNGFVIENPDRLLEDSLASVLDAVDWLVSMFKKRKVEAVIRETVNSIMVSTEMSSHGLYSAHGKQVHIKANITTGQTKMLKNWVHEVLLHEIGHHVHMSYLAPMAKAEWDSGWVYVDKARGDLNDQISVTSRDRHRFWGLIERAGWSPLKAGRRLKGIDRLKFLMWLHKTEGNPLTSTPKQVRLNDYGRTVMRFFANSEAVQAEFAEYNTPEKAIRMMERRERVYKSNLGLTPFYDGKHHPMLDSDTVDQIRSEDTAVDAALDALGIPTQYGRTNILEDFAETFVLFIVDPARLSSTAHTRMARALWLSGFRGKPVMRMATRVASHWLCASRTEDFLEGFYSRHPKLRKYARGLRRIRESTGGSGSHGEARQTGNDILLFPKFWGHSQDIQDFVFAHEIGHWVLTSNGGTPSLLAKARRDGMDIWDTDNLPFGQFNMDEGFADAFASYFLDGDVKRRHPQWAAWIEEYL